MRTTLITARLTLRTPGGVTAPESATTTAQVVKGEVRHRNVLPLRRDPAGALHVPGSAVAGSLRRHCASRPLLADLFGSEPGELPRVPSTIQVLGCVLTSQPVPVERARTAIDRERGAAANRTLHAVEQLPAGTAFDVVLRWNDAGARELDELTTALSAWAPSIGRGSALGAGRCEVTAHRSVDYDLSTVDGLLDWLALADSPGRSYPEPTEVQGSAPPPTAHRSVRFEIVDAVHVGCGTVIRDAQNHEIAILLRSGRDVVIPGSSLKGVLRSRAEYLCRVCGVAACAGTQPSTCDAERPCPPCRIFGRPASRDGQGARRAALAIPDAVVGATVEMRRHVALDRFTGGAREHLLYTDEVMVKGRFTIRLDELAGPLTPAEAALVDAVLADLDAGLIGVGARTTAGYGTVRIIDDSWTAPDLGALAGLLRTGAS